MRPLQLQIEAFGSYAGVERVDFEALGRLGLFLVTGPTGSGKTTIFDALVFALYGTVPGSRRAEEVHSHHAAPGSVPRVVLEVEADGTRWRIERTARHERPVRRGGGTTTEQPTAAMWRKQGDDWVAVASGQREVNGAVIDRIGLTAEQFQRVVLLPQGDFEQFLVARSDDRKLLLRQLFGTEVYERAVDHLRRSASEARAGADDASAQQRRHADALAHHLEQAELLTGSLVSGDTPVADRLERLARSLRAADEARQRTDTIAGAAERDVAGARVVAARWAARDRRRDERDSLAARRPAHDDAVEALDAGRRARPVRDLAGAERRHTERASRADAAVAAAHAAVIQAVDALGAGDHDLARRTQAILLTDDLAAVRHTILDAQDSDRRLAERWRSVEVAEHALVQAADAHVVATAALDRARDAVADAEQEVLVLDAARHRASQLADGLDAARAVAEEAERRRRLRSELARADAALDRAVVDAASAEVSYRRAFAGFLRDAAPRLAAELVDDEPCPVCGATDHPHPAVPDRATAAVSADELDHIRVAAGAAAQHRDELAGRVAGLRGELGADAETLLDVLDERAVVAAHTVAVAGAAAAEVERIEASLVAARSIVDGARTAVAEAAAGLAVAAADVERCRQQHEALARELAGAPPVAVVRARIEQAAVTLQHLDVLQTAEQRAGEARSAARAAAEAVAAAVAAGSWRTAEEALAVALDDAEIDRLAREVDDWSGAWQRVVGQLAADDAELPEDPPDLASLEAFAAEAAAARAAAADRHASLSVHVDLARRAATEVEQVAAAAGAALATAEVAATVYERCAGQLAPKVSLESWVLGAELDRVVDAANVHLEEMTAGRYRLARVTDTTDARSATGLDLVVDDAYTGTSRRTTSLSGGERFQASLSLALGLADVVTAGASATARTLDALFVDEGFGSLDAGALDQAIATLDRLRVHGRQIGVITHVEAMQSALPIGLRVERLPGEAGSRIVQPVGVC